MQDVLLIDRLEQADVLMRPGRTDLLRRMLEPRTCGQLAHDLGGTSQQVYYHVKALETARLVGKVAEAQVRGFREASYQAVARAYWLSPRLVQLGGGAVRLRDASSRGYLIDLAEELHIEVGRLAGRREETPTLGMDAHVTLPDASRRGEFMRELQATVQALATKYGGPAGGESFRLVVACYPEEAGAKE